MASELSAQTIAQLKERAADPAKRCDTSAMHANSIGSEDVWSGMRARIASHDAETQRGIREYIESTNSPLTGLMANALFGDGSGPKAVEGMLSRLMGGKASFAMMDGQTIRHGGSAEPEALQPPVDERTLAWAEGAMGFALPPALRAYYAEISNGGVGPGDGIYSVAILVQKWGEQTAKPVGPQGQDWPTNLLPIQGENYELVSIDRDTGRLVFWDMEELDDDDEDLPPDNPTWAKSFKPEAESLDAWLSAWLERVAN